MHQRGPFVRWGRALAAAVIGLALTASVRAQLGATVSADSDYRYRGVSLSDSKPSLRLTLNYDAVERWYAGASLTSARLTGGEGYTQLLGYAGWSTPAFSGTSLELGLDGSHFAGLSGYDFAEAYVGLLGERWSARFYFAPSYYGQHVQTVYAEINAYLALNERSRAFAHIGVLHPLHGAVGEADRTRGDASLGAALVLHVWELHLAWVGASRGGPYPAVYGGRPSALTSRACRSLSDRRRHGLNFCRRSRHTPSTSCAEAQRSARSCRWLHCVRSWRAQWLAVAAVAIVSCGGGGGGGGDGGSPAPFAGMSGYVATSLVSNVTTPGNPYSGSNVDPLLINALGHRLQSAGLRLGRQQRHVDVDALRRQRRAASAGRRHSGRHLVSVPVKPASSSTAAPGFPLTQAGFIDRCERLHLRR